jgi:hypothetical protein
LTAPLLGQTSSMHTTERLPMIPMSGPTHCGLDRAHGQLQIGTMQQRLQEAATQLGRCMSTQTSDCAVPNRNHRTRAPSVPSAPACRTRASTSLQSNPPLPHEGSPTGRTIPARFLRWSGKATTTSAGRGSGRRARSGGGLLGLLMRLRSRPHVSSPGVGSSLSSVSPKGQNTDLYAI